MVTTFLTRGNIKITPETSLVTNTVVFFFFLSNPGNLRR